MIEYYSLLGGVPRLLSSLESELQVPVSSEPAQSLWLDLTDPTPDECEAVSSRYHIPIEHLHAALDFNERPRVECGHNILLIVARTPFREDLARQIPFNTCPIALVQTPEVVVTVCLKPGIISALLNKKILGEGPLLAQRLVLTTLLRISTTFIGELRKLDDRVQKIERTLHKSMQNRELISMLHMEKSLIYFLTALKGNLSVLDKIRNSPLLLAALPEQALLDDVLIENKQATDMAEIYMQIMGSLSDAFGAIVSNNLNKVMKVLTGLTIVFMVPSIIGALYGMNVALPLQDSPFAFAALCVLCLGLSAGVFYILRKMDWM